MQRANDRTRHDESGERAGQGFADRSLRRASEPNLSPPRKRRSSGQGSLWLFADQIAPLTVPIFSFGLVLHGVAMFGKRRIEHRANVPRERWVDGLYWICWLALGGLALLVFTGL